jgi:hypothetical protein
MLPQPGQPAGLTAQSLLIPALGEAGFAVALDRGSRSMKASYMCRRAGDGGVHPLSVWQD